MRRSLYAVGGLVAGTTLLVAVKTGPGAAPVAQDLPAGAAGSQAPAPEGSAEAPPPDRGERAGSRSERESDEGGTFTVTGPAVSNDYGTVQVKITMSGDELTAVEALEMPTSSARSEQLSARVTEDLGAAAVEQQSADLDAVSGASSTSGSYLESLQAALDAAAAGERD
nr:FMN-binding protein [Micromonospora sp. DSM 115978]